MLIAWQQQAVPSEERWFLAVLTKLDCCDEATAWGAEDGVLIIGLAARLTATGSAWAAWSADKMFAVVACGGYLLLRTATLSDCCIKGHLDVLLHRQSAGAFQVIA